jgi:hypothetical protein|tara:strand:- start:273 stop:572 length:300 start_codon:yes stop_codon:yes gene_type:complete
MFKFNRALRDNFKELYFLYKKSVDITVNKDATNCKITPGHNAQYRGSIISLPVEIVVLGNVSNNDLLCLDVSFASSNNNTIVYISCTANTNPKPIDAVK